MQEPAKARAELTPRIELTSPQTAIWLDHVFFVDKPIYNTGQSVAIHGMLDPGIFRQAIQVFVYECDALRLHLAIDGEEPVQWAQPVPEVDVPLIDVSSARNPARTAEEWIERSFWTPLAWSDFPLFRFALIKLAHNHYIWVQKYHHLVIDAVGRQFVTKRISEIYESLSNGDMPPDSGVAPFAAAAEADASYRKSDRYNHDRDYWLARFVTLPDPLIAGSRHRTERARSGRPNRLSFRLGRDTFARLEKQARSQGSTIFKLLVGLVYVTFSRLFNADDLVFGIPLSNRAGRFKETIGLFAQIMPFRISLNRKMDFAAAIKEIDRALTRDYAHRRFPIVELGRLLQLTRQGRFGLYDVSINYVPTDYDFYFAGASIAVTNISSGFFTPWAITIADLGAEAGLDVTVDYDPGLIGKLEAEQVTQCLRFLLMDGMEDLGRPIGTLAIMPDEERRNLVVKGCGPTVDVPESATLASLFVEQAARTPDAIAIICGTEKITYAALDQRASALASHLAEMGVEPEIVVGIALPRTIDMIATILAIHKAGGAYLPLDPAYPAERLAYILKDAGASIILTTSALAASLPATNAQLLFIDQFDWEHNAKLNSKLSPTLSPNHLAYIIYTSGSTGFPKGVCIEHRNVVNFVLWGQSLVGAQDLNGMLFSASLNFDPSVFQLFTPLISGGRIILVENLLLGRMTPFWSEVYAVDSVPSLMDQLLNIGGLPRHLRTITLVGEPLTRTLADRIFAAVPGARLINVYGPTEITVYSNSCVVDPLDRNPPSIGRAIWNTQLYVLDHDLEPVPAGIPGELWIAGHGVAREYRNRPELTEARFRKNPFGEGRLYRTGDMVRLCVDGTFDFLGRSDSQIKINGHRVELGEIEAQLNAIPQISSAACVVHTGKSGVKRLIAYATTKEGQAPPNLASIRDQLERRLPRHMIPATLTWLTALPLTPSGKLDRRALPAPQDEASADEYVPPRDDTEQKLAAIWGHLLKTQTIGVNDDFFESGGDSLQATLLILKVEESFGIGLPAEVVFGPASTIAGMAQEIETRLLTAASASYPATRTQTGQAARLIDVDFAEFEQRPGPDAGAQIFYADPRTGIRRARPNAVFRNKIMNAQGYAGPDIVVPKPKGTLRIAFLGGSTTLDSFVSSNNATWPHLTCRNLMAALPGTTIDYVNAGMPGFNTRHISIQFKEYISAFDPDVAVIQTNDFNADSAYLARSKGIYNGPHYYVSSWAKRSRMWARIEKNAIILTRLLRAYNPRGKLIFTPAELTTGFEERLERLVRACQERCALVVLVTTANRLRRSQSRFQRLRSAATNAFYMPYLSIEGMLDGYEACDEAIRRVGMRTGVPVVEAGRAVPGDRRHFVDSRHFRDAGSECMARGLANAMLSHGVIAGILSSRNLGFAAGNAGAYVVNGEK
jgi:amino acid adenylation domain-containing protein